MPPRYLVCMGISIWGYYRGVAREVIFQIDYLNVYLCVFITLYVLHVQGGSEGSVFQQNQSAQNCYF